jgi:plastocyanin
MKYLFLATAAIALVGAGCASGSAVKDDAAVVTPEVVQVTSTTPNATSTAPAKTPTTTKPSTQTKQPQLQPTSPTTKPKPGPQTQYVTITDSGFSPSVMAVNAGDAVVWVNKSTKNQTSASSGSLLWDSGNIPVGGSYKRVFNAPGSYNYYSGSTNFKGTVVVH